jgi:hypothetical protein
VSGDASYSEPSFCDRLVTYPDVVQVMLKARAGHSGPAELFADYRHGARQAAFRARLAQAGLMVVEVSSPERLETALFQALRELPQAEAVGMPVGRVWKVPARNSAFTGCGVVLAQLRESLQAGGAGGGAGDVRDGGSQDRVGDRVRPPSRRGLRPGVVGER